MIKIHYLPFYFYNLSSLLNIYFLKIKIQILCTLPNFFIIPTQVFHNLVFFFKLKKKTQINNFLFRPFATSSISIQEIMIWIKLTRY